MTNQERIKRIVGKVLEIPMRRVKATEKLTDLGADSLNLVEIAMSIEDQFEVSISDNQLDKASTLRDLYDLVKEDKS